jgi:hypothetical protein
MKIEIEISEKNEATRAPYWIIVDPRQNFSVDDRGMSNVANMITGLFFSREEAKNYLERNYYHFTKHAKVYCHSSVQDCQYGEKVKF